MYLVIKDDDLARLVDDIQYLNGINLRIRYLDHNEQGNWFSVNLTKGQVKRLNNIIPRQTIAERYNSR